jgi:transposase-like protein
MPVLSHLHQLFNAEQCQAYIRTLRWKDRPLQCPRCQSHHIGQWGTYQYRPGCKRYWCHGCKRTFNDLTATLLHRRQRRFCRKFCSGGHEGAVAPVCGGD